MFSEHSFEIHRLGSHQNDMLQNTYALVSMYNFNLLTNQNLSDKGQRVEERNEGNVTIQHWFMWNVIDLHSISHVPHSTPCALKLISDKCYFVTSFYQTLAKLVSVSFYTTEFREGEVRTD